jgi:hypothetical protein
VKIIIFHESAMTSQGDTPQDMLAGHTCFESHMLHFLCFVFFDYVNENNPKRIQNPEDDAICPKRRKTDNPCSKPSVK